MINGAMIAGLMLLAYIVGRCGGWRDGRANMINYVRTRTGGGLK